MGYNNSIDIIIPCYRLDEKMLLPIINLPKPPQFNFFIYIVADNPAAKIPAGIISLANSDEIKLIVNAVNSGPSVTRNNGILAGKSKWILLLDDDIVPNENLLYEYVDAIENRPDAIGFAGTTDFPTTFNAVTKALEINGTVGHFKAAKSQPEMVWAPTANILLNRQKIDPDLFDAHLNKSGEDIDFLVRNHLLFNEKYLSVPDAIVCHPWWDNGKMQFKRMFRYGQGASDLILKAPVRNYAYRDLTNTSETILLLLLVSPLAIMYKKMFLLWAFLGALLLAEFIVNGIKVVKLGKTFSLPIMFNLMMIKNSQELGALYNTISVANFDGFAKRLDLGFSKPNPSPFRLNRWKIIKLILLIVLFSAIILTINKK
jgi:glycosyltransferase involved in cell wall biosynthesis